MSALFALIGRIEKAAAALAAASLGALFLLGFAEVATRAISGHSIPVSLEYSGYLVAASFLLGSGWTLSENRHVRLSLFGASPLRGRMAALIALLLSLALSTGLVQWALGSLARGDVSYFPSATPLWLPQALLALGAVTLSLSLLKRVIEGEKP